MSGAAITLTLSVQPQAEVPVWVSAPLTAPLSRSQLEGGPAEVHRPLTDPSGVRGHSDRPRWEPQVPQQGEERPRRLRATGWPCPVPQTVPFQINYGGDVPKQYYVRDQLAQPYEHTVVVNRGSSHQVEYEILAPGCVLR